MPERPADTSSGLRCWWEPDGVLSRVEYYREGIRVAAVDRGIRAGQEGNPLIEAAQDGDDEAVEACLAAGLGAVSGQVQYAAFVGLPRLAARLALGATDVEPWPWNPEPTRPSNVDPSAVWVFGAKVNGAWMLGDVDPGTGLAVGSWRVWAYVADMNEDRPVPWERTDFVDGRPVLRRSFTRYPIKSPAELAGLAHEDGFPLDTELHFDQRGRVWLRREFKQEPGRLSAEIEQCADGTTANRAFHATGGVCRERITHNNALVSETWFGPDGTRTAEVSPVTEPLADGDRVAVERWRGLAGDRVIAEGLVADGPVGPWLLRDETGTVAATVDFTPLTATGLGLPRLFDLGAIAVALDACERAPWPAALADVHGVDWAELDAFFGRTEHFPLLLKALAQPDARLFELVLETIGEAVYHQDTIEEITGPTMRYLVALALTLDRDDLRARLLDFIVMVATGDGDLDTLSQIGFVNDDNDNDNDDEDDDEDDDEAAFTEMYRAIGAAAPRWAELAASADIRIRRPAVLLLALSTTEDAGRALRERIATEPDSMLVADAVLALVTHGDTEPNRVLLGRLMADAAKNPLVAFCAALTWTRLRARPAARAAGLLVDAVTGQLTTDRYDEAYLAVLSADLDAASALGSAPVEEVSDVVDRLCALLGEVTEGNAVAVVGALLDIVFPGRWDRDKPLTSEQHRVVAAIAASDRVWTFQDALTGELRRRNLAASRAWFRNLAAETADR